MHSFWCQRRASLTVSHLFFTVKQTCSICDSCSVPKPVFLVLILLVKIDNINTNAYLYILLVFRRSSNWLADVVVSCYLFYVDVDVRWKNHWDYGIDISIYDILKCSAICGCGRLCCLKCVNFSANNTVRLSVLVWVFLSCCPVKWINDKHCVKC